MRAKVRAKQPDNPQKSVEKMDKHGVPLFLSIWANQPLNRDEYMEYDRGVGGAVRFESSPRYQISGEKRLQ
jgi:hypothetical protein